MARKLLIFSNNVQAGTLTQLSPNEYEFVYSIVMESCLWHQPMT